MPRRNGELFGGKAMNRRNLLKSGAALGATLLAPGCVSSGGPVTGDAAAFRERVLEVMPGYELTSSMIGRSVRRSPAHAISTVPRGGLGNGPEEFFRAFLNVFEPYGILPCRIIFQDGRAGRSDFWSTNFQGCSAGSCGSTLSETRFSQSSRDEFDRYVSGGPATPGDRIELLRETSDGVTRNAILHVSYDSAWRVNYYTVTFGFPGQDGIYAQYTKNLTLGVETEVSESSPLNRQLGGF